MNRLFGYARVSTDDQTTSAAAQSLRLREFATVSGMELAGLYVDEDVSGSRPLKARPQGRRLWDAVQAGDTVAFTKVDRCFRSMADAATTLAFWKQINVRVNILDLGIDVSSPAGELFFNQLASFAAFERQMIGQRVREALAHRKRSGVPYGNSRPFGWVREGTGKNTHWVACAEERDTAMRALAMRNSGETLATIARKLASEGVTKPGKQRQARAGAYRGCYYLEADIARLCRAATAGFPTLPRDEV
jgi:DNA invertase Pin-like site-specific DNA recombinase